MNSGDVPPGEPGVNPLVRWFVVGLPLGLLIMGALSFVFYFQKRHASEVAATAPSRYAAMLRKDVNLEDYRRYRRIFEQEIGPRTIDQPGNIEAAQSFIESTLGFGNMGYQVVRREFELGGKRALDLEVELKGRSATLEPLLVTARYDGKSDAGISALLVLANAFTGTSHPRTIRFVAWFGGELAGERFDLQRYRVSLPTGGAAEAQARVIEINGPRAEEADALGVLQEAAKALAAAAE